MQAPYSDYYNVAVADSPAEDRVSRSRPSSTTYRRSPSPASLQKIEMIRKHLREYEAHHKRSTHSSRSMTSPRSVTSPGSNREGATSNPKRISLEQYLERPPWSEETCSSSNVTPSSEDHSSTLNSQSSGYISKRSNNTMLLRKLPSSVDRVPPPSLERQTLREPQLVEAKVESELTLELQGSFSSLGSRDLQGSCSSLGTRDLQSSSCSSLGTRDLQGSHNSMGNKTPDRSSCNHLSSTSRPPDLQASFSSGSSGAESTTSSTRVSMLQRLKNYGRSKPQDLQQQQQQQQPQQRQPRRRRGSRAFQSLIRRCRSSDQEASDQNQQKQQQQQVTFENKENNSSIGR